MAILAYHFAMDVIIWQTMHKEMRRSTSLVSERVASLEVELSDLATTGILFIFITNSEPPIWATES